MSDVLSDGIIRSQVPRAISFNERIFTETYEYRTSDVSDEEKTVYVLDNAPFSQLVSVTATVNGEQRPLVIGFEVVPTSTDDTDDGIQNAIEFGSENLVVPRNNTVTVQREQTIQVLRTGSITPDPGTEFTVVYKSQSVADRYVGSYEDEFSDINDRVEYVSNSHDITDATGNDLDNIGSIFGIIGQRRGRTDDEYRTFLQSIVQSFAGRGTVSGIEFAVSSGLDISTDDVTVIERFTDNSYILAIDTFTGNTRIIEQLAELSDPSGVEYRGQINYTDDDGQVGIQGEPLSAKELQFVSLGDSTLGQETLGSTTTINIYQ